ncbi:LamB/YcsF family protein [Pseudoalteromonas denitrificans]|uniref:UPF0271 protein n=1 Tax=Pseudoalteromonas denitrificans DSM 6059 TaxID=1123010 RepID=A0A1I1P7U2_9GAMM|nr:LamB/YcsF family protein [Pseudoalteromonas denitrificans]SFD02070.1 UPF0271 protein [Pseudoalteromonas denitrificans DSM 6059]
MKVIDINCDLGEGGCIDDCDLDAKLMQYISSCNIACGGHAGNEEIIRKSLLNAQLNGLKIGAHPGYADKKNFGRISLKISSDILLNSIQEQLDLFLKIASELDIHVEHIKFHGALYNDLEQNPDLASSLSSLIKQNYAYLKVVGLAGGLLEKKSRFLGLSFLPEGFMDRSYLSTGMLTPRSKANAMIEGRKNVINQALLLANNDPILTSDHQYIKPKVKTICLHGDNVNAISIAKNLNESLVKAGFIIK